MRSARGMLFESPQRISTMLTHYVVRSSLLVALASASAGHAIAQLPPPRLLKDIVPPPNIGSDPEWFAQLGPRAFFVADGEFGTELYRTDGTPGSTELFLDIAPGPRGSDPVWPVAVGDRLCFSAFDVVHGREFYVSDGTAAGTTRIDLSPGPNSSGTVSTFPLEGRNALLTTTRGMGTELWVTDCTAAGTFFLQAQVPGLAGRRVRMLSDAAPAAGGGTIRYLAATIIATNVDELWISNGTPAGTKRVAAFPDTQLSWGIPVAPGRFVFTARGAGLHVADTVAGSITQLLTIVNPVLPHLVAFDGGAFLPYGTAADVLGVWTDGRSVVDVVTLPGSRTNGSEVVGKSGGALWLIAGGNQLVRVDSSTRRVTVVGTTLTSRIDGSIAAVGSRFYYGGSGLFEIDTTTGRSRQVFAGTVGAREVFGYLGRVLFAGDDGTTGLEPWSYVPGAARAEQLADLGFSTATPGSFASGYRRYGERLVFTADDAAREPRPWVSDGTTAGTVPLDPAPPSTFRTEYDYHEVGGSLWIIASDPSSARVQVSDGTPSGTRLLTTIRSSATTAPISSAHALGDRLVFAGGVGSDLGVFTLDDSGTTQQLVSVSGATSRWSIIGDARRSFVSVGPIGQTGARVWATDGTPAGTRLLGSFGSASVTPQLVSFDDQLWIAYDGGVYAADAQGLRPFAPAAGWRTRLLLLGDHVLFALGAAAIHRIEAGTGTITSAALPGHPLQVDSPVPFGRRLLFRFQGQLWASDGTTTELLEAPPALVFPGAIWVAHPGLALFAVNGSGPQLGTFATDGTPGAAVQVYSGSAQALAAVNSKVFFTPLNSPWGAEPHVIDLGAAVETTGDACTGGDFDTVSFTADRAPQLGSLIILRGRAANATAAAIILGLPAVRPQFLPGELCSLQVDLGSVAVVGPLATDADGGFRAFLPIPAVPALEGIRAVFQTTFSPGAGALTYSLSSALVVQLGR